MEDYDLLQDDSVSSEESREDGRESVVKRVVPVNGLGFS